jgi:glycosyltransferase involved in cell wall biosynthesis
MALSEAIGGLLAEPARRDSLAKGARDRAVSEFGPDSHITRLEALLAEGAQD